jgi:hypothetical protein
MHTYPTTAASSIPGCVWSRSSSSAGATCIKQRENAEFISLCPPDPGEVISKFEMIAGTYLVAVVFDQLFHPINHKEESIFSNHTDIPGSQPPFRIQNLGGGLLVTKVTCTNI